MEIKFIMKYLNLMKEKFSSLFPMWLVIMLAAIWSVANQEGSINRDSLLYMKQAYLISEGNFKEGLAFWPFFSLLIAFVHKITNINLQWAAHAVDLVLFGIAVYYYLKIVKMINQKKHIIFYAGLLLLSFVPILDDYVGMILRDPGFWGGCMAGTYFYFKYISQNCALKYNLLWQFSFMIAGAFRPEGLIFLVAIPLFNIFFIQNNYRKNSFFKFFLNQFIFLILACLCFFIIKTLTIGSELPIDSGGRLNEFGPRIISFFKQLSSQLPIYSDNYILNSFFQKNPVSVTITFLGSLFLMKIIKGLGILNIILMFTHFRKGSKISSEYLKPLYFLIIIGFSLVFVSFVNNFVLTDRYFIFSYFWILIILTPILHSYFESNSGNKNNFRNFLVILIIIISILTVIIDYKKNNIEKEAGMFLKSLQLDNEVTLIDSHRVAYYAEYSIQQILYSSSNLSDNLDWLVVYTKDKLNFLPPLGYVPFKSFEYNNKAVIFLKKQI